MRPVARLMPLCVASLLLILAWPAASQATPRDEADGDRDSISVDCEDFWIEGYGLSGDRGLLEFRRSDVVGDEPVLTADWKGQSGRFLAGPFVLPPGTYRVDATVTVEDENATGERKTLTMLEVAECAAPPADATLCLEEGQRAPRLEDGRPGPEPACRVRSIEGGADGGSRRLMLVAMVGAVVVALAAIVLGVALAKRTRK